MVSTSVPLLKPPDPDTPLAHGDRPREDGAIKRAWTTVLVNRSSISASSLCERLERVLRQLERGLGIVVQLLRNQVSIQQFLRAFGRRASPWRARPRPLHRRRAEARCCCNSLSSSLNSRASLRTWSPMSTGSSSNRPLISGRTETCSAGLISPAAFTAKLMLV